MLENIISDNEEKYQEFAKEMIKKIEINDSKDNIDSLISILKESDYFKRI